MVALVWLFSTVFFHVYPQTSCVRWCIVTQPAFVGLFPSVCFHVCPQITCQRWCIFTLVAFVWLFSTVGFHMSPQFACFRGCKVTLVAFVWLFSSVYFQMCHQIACLRFVANRVFPLSSLLLFMTMMITMLRMRMMVKSWHLSSVSLTRIKTKRSRGLSLCQVSVMLKESLNTFVFYCSMWVNGVCVNICTKSSHACNL